MTENEEGRREVADRVGLLLNEVEHRLDEGFAAEALVLAQQTLKLIQRHPDLAKDLCIDAHYLLASCHFERRDVRAALQQYAQVHQLDSGDPEVDYWRARALFHLWRFEEAKLLLDEFSPNPNTRAGSLYYRALIHDFLGQPEGADVLFARAEEEDPNEFPRPFRLASTDFEGAMKDTLLSLPLDVRRALQDVQIELHPLPNPEHYACPEFDPLILGLCRRRGELALGPSARRHPEHGIEIYQRNLERVSTDRDELVEEMRRTVVSEIGHHLGYERHPGSGTEPVN